VLLGLGSIKYLFRHHANGAQAEARAQLAAFTALLTTVTVRAVSFGLRAACAVDHPEVQSTTASAKLNALNMRSSFGFGIAD
jgi:hypothetical protein